MSGAPAAQRARGAARLSVRRRGGASVLADLRQAGSAKLMFPHARADRLPAVWLNTAGGITGGDRFTLEATAQAGAAMSLTSQAAERIYRAAGAEPGQVEMRLNAAAGARIDWLPQETILYDGAALDRRLEIDLAADATCLACETLIFGRTAMGERVRRLHLRDRLNIRRDGVPVFADRLRLDGDAAAALDGGAVAAGALAMSTLVFTAPGAAMRLAGLRASLPATAGASAPGPDLLIARLLAADGFEMRRALIPILRSLSGADLPRPWMI